MRCHILENNLHEALGHYLNATAGLKRELERRRVTTLVYTHIRASPDVLERVAGRGIFRHRSWEGDGEPDPIAVMGRIGADFARACDAIDDPAPEDLLLVPTAQHAQAYGLALHLESLPPERRPRPFVHVHWGSWDTMERQSAWRIAARRLVAAAGEGRAIFAASSDEMARSFAAVIGQPVQRVPLPQDYGEEPNTMPPPAAANPMIVVLGRSLPRKGSHLLPIIILLARLISPRLRFFVQVTKDLWSVRLLRAIPGVAVHEGALDSAEYLKRVASSDIVLMPYRRQDYIGRTSGIFAECAALGRVAVVPGGTWLSDQIELERAAGVTYPDERSLSILRALLHAARALPQLSRDARARADYWWQNESVSAFADRILRLSPPPQTAERRDAAPFLDRQSSGADR